MDQNPGFCPGTTFEGVLVAALGNDHLLHRQFVLPREYEVALVVGRDPHHCAGAVVGEDVVGDPEGDKGAIGWVAHPGTDRHTPFGFVVGRALKLALAAHQITEGLHVDRLLGGGQPSYPGVFWGQHQVADAKDGVRACCEHGDLFTGAGAR